MRILLRIGSIALLPALLSCSDESATSPEITQPHTSFGVTQEQGKAFKANGNRITVFGKDGVKHYSVKVDKNKKEIEITTLSSCNRYDLWCDNWVSAPIQGNTVFGEGPATAPFACPPTVYNSPVTFTLFNWNGHNFYISGDLVREYHLGNTLGIPRARYSLPPGPFESTDDQATIWNGTLDGTCFCWPDATAFHGYRGIIVWTNFQGNAEEWTLGSGSGGGANFDLDGDGDAEVALNDFLEDGVCPDGWVILVDNVRVC